MGSMIRALDKRAPPIAHGSTRVRLSKARLHKGAAVVPPNAQSLRRLMSLSRNTSHKWPIIGICNVHKSFRCSPCSNHRRLS